MAATVQILGGTNDKIDFAPFYDTKRRGEERIATAGWQARRYEAEYGRLR